MICAKGGFKSESKVGFLKLLKMSAKNYPGIEEIKIPTFFAFTSLIYLLQILRFYTIPPRTDRISR